MQKKSIQQNKRIKDKRKQWAEKKKLESRVILLYCNIKVVLKQKAESFELESLFDDQVYTDDSDSDEDSVIGAR